MAPRRSVVAALLLCLIQSNIGGAASPDRPASLPDAEVAARAPNSFRIFNAVHSALRQWGSSVQHNGLSFFPVTIPEGNLFYHGRPDREIPDSFEWLAFEMEHASLFAQSRERDDHPLSPSMLRNYLESGHPTSLHGRVSSLQAQARKSHSPDEPGHASSPPNDQHPLAAADDPDDPDGRPPVRPPRRPAEARGYLQTYRAARPLHLLYLDGMAAATCRLGTLDTQNVVLLDWADWPDPERYEWERAAETCDLARAWGGGIDGFLRMEAGFEIIYCNFSAGAGLDLVSTRGSPWRNETHAPEPEWRVSGTFEWMRQAATRYHGLPRGRAQVDFSGMVSAFAYDLNTTNPDVRRPDLPRVVSATAEERRAIRARVRDVLRDRRGRAASSVDWQAVVDNIVTRLSDRLWFLAEAPLSARYFRSQLATLLYPFLDFPSDVSLEDAAEPIARCTDHHLLSVASERDAWTPEDRAIYAAIRAVSHTICDSLFAMRREVHTTNGTAAGEDDAAARTRSLARDLRAQLNWTTWKDCGKCPDPEQMCFVAMFPVGEQEDHFTPRCKTQDEMRGGYFVDWRASG